MHLTQLSLAYIKVNCNFGIHQIQVNTLRRVDLIHVKKSGDPSNHVTQSGADTCGKKNAIGFATNINSVDDLLGLE